MQDIRRKKQLMLIQFIDPHTHPTEITIQIIPEKTSDLDIDSLEQDINIDFEENSPHLGVMSEIYQRPDKSQSPEFQSQVDMGKEMQRF